MFRKARGAIREVEPEVVSPAELALVSSVDTEVPTSSEEIEAVEVEVAPPVAVMAPPPEAEPTVELDEPNEAARTRAHPPRPKRRRPERSSTTQKAASTMPAPPPTPAPIPEPVEEIVREPEPEAEQPALLEDLTCEILFWRGYRKATFYARIFSVDGEPLALAQSASFRARGNGTPEQSDEALAAYQALRAQLEQSGWQHVGSGRAWFGDVFSRPL